MKKIIVVLMVLAGMALHSVYAQEVLQPSKPNEVCAEAWEKYKKGDTLWKTGWGLFGAGAGLAVAGGVTGWLTGFGTSARPPEERDPSAYIAPKTGWALMGIGCGVFVASIPCIIVGQVRRKKALKIYNEQCEDQTPLSFSIQSSSNGLGLAMSF